MRLGHARLGLIEAADPRVLERRILGLIAATGVLLRDHRSTRISFDRKLGPFVTWERRFEFFLPSFIYLFYFIYL